MPKLGNWDVVVFKMTPGIEENKNIQCISLENLKLRPFSVKRKVGKVESEIKNCEFFSYM